MKQQARIAVIGSANIDLTTFTDAFPRPGETIFGREFHLGFGGKGANQAVAARLCGAEVSMLARVGDDLFGPATVRNLESRGIDASRVLVTPGVSSGVAPIFVDSSGQNRIWVVKGANGALLADSEGTRHIPPFAVAPVDTTGAGDAFIGSLACFLAGGCAESEAIERANLYAALSTLSAGTQSSFVTRDRFEAEWVARKNAAGAGIA